MFGHEACARESRFSAPESGQSRPILVMPGPRRRRESRASTPCFSSRQESKAWMPAYAGMTTAGWGLRASGLQGRHSKAKTGGRDRGINELHPPPHPLVLFAVGG